MIRQYHVLMITLALFLLAYLWIDRDWFCLSGSETCNGEMQIVGE